MDERLEQLKQWLADIGQPFDAIEPASADASFRRYFRLTDGESTRIIMDAPPEKEDSAPFVDIAARLQEAGVNVPEVLQQDLAQGYVLLSDLGHTLYLDALDADTVEGLYADALDALAAMQAGADISGLPPYDTELLEREMRLFTDWLLQRQLGLELSDVERSLLETAFAGLIDNALAQPQVFVHRDYHSRNLMLLPTHNPGIIDFQDAVRGPLTYDLVSLLRDCYIAWPRERVNAWALGFRELAIRSGVLARETATEQDFLRWFDWMGVQRHLKAAGIFARLNLRDRKPGYLKDIPRTLAYIVEVAPDYAELQPLGEFIRDRVLPGLD
ncbi:aminoglycoside phosphotransferase [Thiohalobacter sp. COW1]|uniref:aminoglycoside phosphotransferase family protein n=1 Tax=Thiohalobacter sp. COW1 TaxID=2795687 RepID=UPI001936AB6D|nr:phosphotransferase [Thiohalobacter sp. COW1]BCO32816.1 aminoglycoside phosphotransferase [Thiohalobacter sp. COW1]